MKPRFFLAFAFALSLVPLIHTRAADFSAMSPTVKVTSYKKLYNDELVAYGSGSGTVLSADGLVLTNHHVIFDDYEQKPLDAFSLCLTLSVQEPPSCRYTAELLADDKNLDLALLKITARDVFGNAVPALAFLQAQEHPDPKEQSSVTVVGYPASGCETITISRGQVSGFEAFNGHRYFKTDTDFDHGSSGGTALDAEGRFVGVPTYIRSYAENVGYFLDLSEALPWIAAHRADAPQRTNGAAALLSAVLQRLEKANQEHVYTSGVYPFFSVSLPAEWRFVQIESDGFYASEEKKRDGAAFSVFINPYPYAIGAKYLAKLDEELLRLKKQFPDFKKESVTFAGQKAWKITYTSLSERNTAYYVPYGYALLGVSHSVDLDNAEAQEKSLVKALEGFRFTAPAKDHPPLPDTVSFDEPPFQIASAPGWRLQKHFGSQPMDVLVDGVAENNFEGSLTAFYRPVAKDERELSSTKRLNEATEALSDGNVQIVSKNDAVTVDGLPGFFYTYEYEGQDYQKLRKRLVLNLRAGDHEFIFQYDDLTDTFDKNLPTLEAMLRTFDYAGEDSGPDGEFTLSLALLFSDLQYHRFATSISSLAEKGIVSGYSDGTFRPEQTVSRAEALKIILESKNHLDTKRGSKKAVHFETLKKNTSPLALRDVRPDDWFAPYARLALRKGVVTGTALRPRAGLTLGEALQMLFKAYEIPLWKGKVQPATKPALDKAYELGLLPRGLENPDHVLTRAELAYLVSGVYDQAK